MKFLRILLMLLLFSKEVVFATPRPLITPTPINLPKRELQLGKIILEVPMATTPEERAVGLMYRTSLGVNEGMLFVFDFPQQVAFWMKNTPVPLSIAYISPSGIILEIYDLTPLSETLVKSIFTSILYALEMPRGWFEQNSIQPGMIIKGLPLIQRHPLY